MKSVRGAKLFAVAALTLFVFNAPATFAQNWTKQTKHFDLHIETGDADEQARVLEQLYDQLQAFYGREPAQRLRMKVFSNEQNYLSALHNDDVKDPRFRDSAGDYVPEKQVGYVWASNSRYQTRSRLIYAVASAFRQLTREQSRARGPAFLHRGVCLRFKMHEWDGQTLKTAVVPIVSQGNIPWYARQRFHIERQGDLRKAMEAPDSIDWGEDWAIVSFLMAKDRHRFDKWEALLEQNVKPLVAWDEVWGDLGRLLNADYERWLKSNQQLLCETSGDWSSVDGVVTGQAERGRLITALLPEPVKSLSAELMDVESSGGLIISTQQAHYTSRVAKDGRIDLQRYMGANWELLGTWALPEREKGKPVKLALKSDGTHAALIVNDRELTRINFADTKAVFGLNASDGKAMFRNVQTESFDH